jgi:arsenate reductase
MTESRQVYVLFLCTGNSCRSQMAEAWLRHLGGNRFDPYSAGTRPAGFVHQLAIDAMKQAGIDISEQESKPIEDIMDMPFDVVITLCDSAAAEACPTWRGAPITVHWPLPDPAYHPGTPDERLQFAVTVARRLENKIRSMIALDFSQDKEILKEQLQRLGEI